jgi:hypothetical protein
MAILVAIVLGLLALVFVLYPLLPGSARADADAQGQTSRRHVQIGQPGEREQAARDALQEVELDYQLGNIAEPDYRTLRERYMRKAVVALKSRYEHNERDEPSQTLDDLIEMQLRKMREQGEHAEQE